MNIPVFAAFEPVVHHPFQFSVWKLDFTGFGTLGGVHLYNGMGAEGRPLSFGGYGKQLKDDYRRLYGATVGFAGRGEMIPNESSYCEIDPAVVDRWGIPVLRFHWKWSDHELNQVRHMQQTFRAILEGMGGQIAAAGRGGRANQAASPPAQTGQRAGGQAPQTGQAGPQTGQATTPAGQPTTMGQQAAANGGVPIWRFSIVFW